MFTTHMLIGALLAFVAAGSSSAQTEAWPTIGRTPEAGPTVTRNALLAPGKARAAIARAHKEILAGHMESAERDIAHALEIAPHFGVAEVMRAAIDLQKGKFAVAGQRFQEAMTDDPGLGAAYLGMSVVLIHEQEFQAALSLLDRAEGLLPSVWMIHFEKAWTELGIGDSQAALFQAHIADRFVGEDDERKSGMSYLRAMIAIHQKNEDAARDYLAEAIARRPGGNYATLALKARQELQPLLASGR